MSKKRGKKRNRYDRDTFNFQRNLNKNSYIRDNVLKRNRKSVKGDVVLKNRQNVDYLDKVVKRVKRIVRRNTPIVSSYYHYKIRAIELANLDLAQSEYLNRYVVCKARKLRRRAIFGILGLNNIRRGLGGSSRKKYNEDSNVIC